MLARNTLKKIHQTHKDKPKPNSKGWCTSISCRHPASFSSPEWPLELPKPNTEWKTPGGQMAPSLGVIWLGGHPGELTGRGGPAVQPRPPRGGWQVGLIEQQLLSKQGLTSRHRHSLAAGHLGDCSGTAQALGLARTSGSRGQEQRVGGSRCGGRRLCQP